jgi:hypothetical protein
MPGAQCARSLACKIKKHTSIVTTVTPGSPGIPRAMVLTVSFVLSPVTGLCCHRRQQVITCQLDASVGASGPHDFAVRVTRCSSAAHQRPPHPAPTSVTCARPLCGTGWRAYNFDLGQRRKEIFLQTGLDRKSAGSAICPSTKSVKRRWASSRPAQTTPHERRSRLHKFE